MILKRLTLQDFGVYAGEQVIDLAPPTSGSPVTVIGGQNGEGKTTLLEAILHVLYGPHAGSIIGRGGRYDQYLKSSIAYSADPSRGAAVKLEFSTVREGREVLLGVRRSWQAQGGQTREQLTVEVDGRFDRPLTDGWSDFVETIIPRGVAPLFFFDGEQIESLADLEGAAGTIKAAIGSLLGLDLVEQLRADLLVLQRRHASKKAPGDAQENLETAETAAEESDRQVQSLRDQYARARSALDQATAELRRANDLFEQQGGELFEKRTEIEAEYESAQSELRDVRAQLRESAAGIAPLLLVEQQLSELVAAAREEAESEVGRQLAVALERRDEEFTSWLQSAEVAEDDTLKSVSRWLADNRAQFSSTDQPDRIVGLDQVTLRRLEHLVESGVDIERGSITRLRTRLGDVVVRCEQAERHLVQIPSDDAIEGLVENRERAKREEAERQEALSLVESELQFAVRERDRRYDERDKTLRKVAELGLAEGDSKRILEHADKARETLTRLYQQSVERHIRRIETMVEASLDELLRKESLIDRIEIDPTSFELKLFGRAGRNIQPSDLSAGERQLTALSLLWGLARASGRPLPLIIDTPLGRLDSTHRQLMLERYLPKASHQTIVLSTDTEVDEAALQMLGSAVGRTYRLTHSDSDQKTVVDDGYFFDGLEVAA